MILPHTKYASTQPICDMNHSCYIQCDWLMRIYIFIYIYIYITSDYRCTFGKLLGIFESSFTCFVTLCCRFLPQSPFWLLSCGKQKEAKAVLNNMAEKNGRKPFDDTITLSENNTEESSSKNGYTKYHLVLLIGRTILLSVIW